jgi:hypothetical protein
VLELEALGVVALPLDASCEILNGLADDLLTVLSPIEIGAYFDEDLNTVMSDVRSYEAEVIVEVASNSLSSVEDLPTLILATAAQSVA